MKIKKLEEAKNYIKKFNFNNPLKESEVKMIFKSALSEYFNKILDLSLLTAICIELLYFKNNIGEFEDRKLQQYLLMGDKLAYLITLNTDSNEIEEIIKNFKEYLSNSF